jgi:Galactose oxidase, central domain
MNDRGSPKATEGSSDFPRAKGPRRRVFAIAGGAGLVAAVVAVALLSGVIQPIPASSVSASAAPFPAQPSASPSSTSSGKPASPGSTPASASASSPTASSISSAPTGSAAAQFTPTGAMTAGRDGPTATLLEDGKVLVAGGKVAQGLAETATPTAELYDPARGKFSPTGSMAAGRWGHTATRLEDGRVLVVGGADLADGYANLKTAELYDPATGKFSATGSMAVGRADHTATLLADGRVLIAGGTNSVGLDSAELYDPATAKFSATGPMTVARQDHTATRLADGRVLVAGGFANGVAGPFGTLVSAEVYDPAGGRFSGTGSMTAPRQNQTATLLPDGSVMVIGGVDQNARIVTTAESYDPAAGTFGRAGAWAFGSTATRTSVLLSDGHTLLTIGLDQPGANAETWDGGHRNFYQAGSTAWPVACQTATLLQNGLVLLLGGSDATGKPAAIATLYRLGSQY